MLCTWLVVGLMLLLLLFVSCKLQTANCLSFNQTHQVNSQQQQQQVSSLVNSSSFLFSLAAFTFRLDSPLGTRRAHFVKTFISMNKYIWMNLPSTTFEPVLWHQLLRLLLLVLHCNFRLLLRREGETWLDLLAWVFYSLLLFLLLAFAVSVQLRLYFTFFHEWITRRSHRRGYTKLSCSFFSSCSILLNEWMNEWMNQSSKWVRWSKKETAIRWSTVL